ncbi:MAG: hypothetical protein KC442_19600 [Thermomicrobiales bacterium]|nr:hypothetical protein [Thermomicrobiales bacterium]
MSGELAAVGLVAVVVLLVALALVGRRRETPPPATVAATSAPARIAPATGLIAELSELQATGQWDTLLRRLDTVLPEWPVSSSLIEVTRAIGNLNHDLALLPQDPVNSVVTKRMQAQTDAVTTHLWQLADRLVLAERLRGPALPQRLQQEDAVLLRLLPAIRTAQAELADLAVSGDTTATLRRAEGRFLALGETARELQGLSG